MEDVSNLNLLASEIEDEKPQPQAEEDKEALDKQVPVAGGNDRSMLAEPGSINHSLSRYLNLTRSFGDSAMGFQVPLNYEFL